MGERCQQCMPGFYLPDPSSSNGCQLCGCNIGGSTDIQCDQGTGACLCRTGIQGRTCSVVQDEYFIRGIDHLILEAEDATDSPVIVTDRQNMLFTGIGFFGVQEGVSVIDFGLLSPPAGGLYEVVIRYNLDGTLFWNSSTLTVVASSSEDTMGPPDCGGAPEITDQSSLAYTNFMMGVGLSVTRTVCLRGGREYLFTLSNFTSGQSDDSAVLNIDSLVLIPVELPGLSAFDDPVISREYRSCVDFSRSLATQLSSPISCQQIIFTVSAEIYDGAAGKSVGYYHVDVNTGINN